MGRRSSIDDLPVEVRRELKARVREASYGAIERNLDWLRENGLEVSRSALGRYVKRLREEDWARGLDSEVMVLKPAKIAALWDELATLRAREDEIMAILRSQAKGEMIPGRGEQDALQALDAASDT